MQLILKMKATIPVGRLTWNKSRKAISREVRKIELQVGKFIDGKSER